MEYLKLFENQSDYSDFLENEYIEPNVSYCIDENEVLYNWTPQISSNVPIWNYLKSIAGPNNLGYWDRYFFNFYQILQFTHDEYDENTGELLYKSVSFEAVENGNSRVAWYPYCEGIIVETNDPENYPLTEITYRGRWSDCK